MNLRLDPQHLIWLFGGSALLFAILLVIVVVFYRFKRSMSKSYTSEEISTGKVRASDEAAFTLATVKSVLTQLKEEQKVTQEKLLASERRAEQNARKFDLLAREIDFGLVIFDAQGFIAFSNPQARKILGVDTWARRRYAEIFSDAPALAQMIASCFQTGTEVRKQVLSSQDWAGGQSQVEVTLLPSRDKTGAFELVACVFREVQEQPDGATPEEPS